MKTQQKEKHHFIVHLESLRDSDDRGALAALRRGLGKPPGTVPAMFPHVAPRIREGALITEEETYYLVASLFALHPDSTSHGDMGSHFSALVKVTGSDSVSKRFIALLNCHSEDLYNHLRHAISLLKSKDIAVNWDRLLRDLMWWNHEDRFVQRRWASSFWSKKSDTVSEKDGE